MLRGGAAGSVSIVSEPFAVAMRRARIEAGVSQYSMAHCLGTAQPNISTLECWQSCVSERMIRRWAAVLGCRVELRFIPQSEVRGSESKKGEEAAGARAG